MFYRLKSTFHLTALQSHVIVVSQKKDFTEEEPIVS